MSSLNDFLSSESPTWCPGCGDYTILKCLKDALVTQGLAPHEVMVVSGIGCGSKVPYYLRSNGYDTLHGRALPVAQGIKLANHALKVIVVSGDGDSMGIGGNHFLHTMRRNPDLTHVIENNQIYGLTKGQFSPTSPKGFVTSTSPDGSLEVALNPMVLGVAGGATFVSRTFSGDVKHMVETLVRAMKHRGYSVIDVLQPCVTFNKINTFKWYKERVYDVAKSADYRPGDRQWAFAKALEWGEKIPIGVIYENTSMPTYEDQVTVLQEGPLAGRDERENPIHWRVLAGEEKLKHAFC